MESNNLTTRTYTAPTCALIVSTKTEPRLNQPGVPMDFILHFEDPDRREVERVTLHGQAQQLDRLQQVVNKYIAQLVAQFPLPGAKRIVAIEPEPNATDAIRPNPEPAADTPSSAQLNPQLDPRAARSGIIKNLPGLQKNTASAPPPAPKSDGRSMIDKLLGRGSKSASPEWPIGRSDGHLPTALGHQNVTNHPYLTGVNDTSPEGEIRQSTLDHQLHLGNLATPASGETMLLSAIQLFDLATVLDEYTAETLAASTKGTQTPTGFGRASIPVNSERPIEMEAVSSRSRLPNLPLIPAEPETNPIYYRTRRPRATWASSLPWIVGATVALGASIFVIDPNFKPFKDIASMMKTPSLGESKKATPTKPGTGETTATTATTTTTTTTGTLPTQWQAQPVQPPTAIKPTDAGASTAQNPSKIGVAPLPDAIATQPGQTPNALGTPSGTNQPSAASILSGNSGQSATGVATNPLNATQPSATATSTTGTGIKTTKPASSPSTAKTPTKKTTTNAQLPTEITTPGTFSVSKQPIAIPPVNSTPATNPPFKPIPVNPSTQVLNQIDPATRTPAPKKSATQSSRPLPNSVITPSSTAEPFTPVPKNPNLIDPNQPNSAAPELQNPPVVPDRPLQSNNGGGIDPETPLLQESKRYFQGKWKADNNQPNSLQYVLQVNGKSGVVRSIDPQGEAASAYLRQTKFVKPGQKLVSPAAAGSSDQKIRVLLQPDGNVDTFIEP